MRGRSPRPLVKQFGERQFHVRADALDLGEAILARFLYEWRERVLVEPEPPLASFAVRAFIRFPVLLLASCDEYGRICNSERDRHVRDRR
jgi:hypothetical protein